VIGIRSIVRRGAQVRRSVLLGADFYEDTIGDAVALGAAGVRPAPVEPRAHGDQHEAREQREDRIDTAQVAQHATLVQATR